MFARMLRIFAGYVYTCHNQKKQEKNKKTLILDSELAGSENPNTNNHKHTTQLIQGAPQKKGRG